MSGFGFDNRPVRLPKLAAVEPRKAGRAELADVARVGRELGFVPREVPRPAGVHARKRRREKRSNMLIHGPERILARFRDYADEADLSYWEALEVLLDRNQ